MFKKTKRAQAAFGSVLMLLSVIAFGTSLCFASTAQQKPDTVISASVQNSSVKGSNSNWNKNSIRIQYAVNNLLSVSANEAKKAGTVAAEGVIDKYDLEKDAKVVKATRGVSQAVLKVSTGIVWDYDNGVMYGCRGDGLASCGFDYDIDEDIFYSAINPWQRNFGYCKFYDDAAAYLDMDYDTLRFYFNYGGKDWLLQVWKGRYGITTGGEVGIYKKSPNSKVDFYQCANDDEMLEFGMTVYHNGKKLFTREPSYHWWQTGFVLGYMADKEDVGMSFSVKFDDADMLKAFKKAIPKSKNYSYTLKNNTFYFKWNVK